MKLSAMKLSLLQLIYLLPILSSLTVHSLTRSKPSSSVVPTIKKKYTVTSQQRRSGDAIVHSKSTTTALQGQSFSDNEDLPNILGINPIEAAVIFGALYFVYGPDKLYEVVREAGRLFSTYGPVAKEIASDVYFEFRDYLDENREREELRKQGVDVEDLPRRTTNVIERFQESMNMLSEMSDSSTSSSILVNAYRDGDSDSSESAIEKALTAAESTVAATAGGKKRRKSKKEILEARNVNVKKVVEATEKMADTGFKETFELMQSRLSAAPRGANQFGTAQTKTAVAVAATGAAPDDRLDSLSDFYQFPGDDDDFNAASESTALLDQGEAEGVADWGLQQRLQAEAAAIKDTSPGAAATTAAAAVESKFQQQLSGAWNQRVVGGEADSADSSSAFAMSGSDRYSDDVIGVEPRVGNNFKPFSDGSNVATNTTAADMVTAAMSTTTETSSSVATPAAADALTKTIGMSKFQQQMSGQWNQRVLRKEKYAGGGSSQFAAAGPISAATAASEFKEDSFAVNENLSTAYEGSLSELSTFMLQGNYAAEPATNVASTQSNTEFVANIPEDLSASDCASQPINAAAAVGDAGNGDGIGYEDALATASQQRSRGLEILKEIDRDYMALRQKFVGYISAQEEQLQELEIIYKRAQGEQAQGQLLPQQQQTQQEQMKQQHLSHKDSFPASQRKYWPPQRVIDYSSRFDNITMISS